MMYLVSVAFTGGKVRRGVFDNAGVFLHPVTETATGWRGLLLRGDSEEAGNWQAALPGGGAHLAGKFLGSVERKRWHVSIGAYRKANGKPKSSTPGERRAFSSAKAAEDRSADTFLSDPERKAVERVGSTRFRSGLRLQPLK